jgi:antitoxin component YwqK of YwqJK toxin-antitoxin module
MAKKQDGPFEERYDNGQLKEEGTLKDGVKHGLCRSYNESGELESEYNWEKGSRSGRYKYYAEDGRVTLTGIFYRSSSPPPKPKRPSKPPPGPSPSPPKPSPVRKKKPVAKKKPAAKKKDERARKKEQRAKEDFLRREGLDGSPPSGIPEYGDGDPRPGWFTDEDWKKGRSRYP